MGVKHLKSSVSMKGPSTEGDVVNVVLELCTVYVCCTACLLTLGLRARVPR